MSWMVTFEMAPSASSNNTPTRPPAPQSTPNPVPRTVTFVTFIVCPPLVTTPPLKKPPTGSWAVIVNPCPSSVKPSGTSNGTFVSQFAVNVKVEPAVVPVQANSTGAAADANEGGDAKVKPATTSAGSSSARQLRIR